MAKLQAHQYQLYLFMRHIRSFYQETWLEGFIKLASSN
jgi:hypothetical protein